MRVDESCHMSPLTWVIRYVVKCVRIYIYIYIYYIHVCELCMSYVDAGLGDVLVGDVCMWVNE